MRVTKKLNIFFTIYIIITTHGQFSFSLKFLVFLYLIMFNAKIQKKIQTKRAPEYCDVRCYNHGAFFVRYNIDAKLGIINSEYLLFSK